MSEIPKLVYYYKIVDPENVVICKVGKLTDGVFEQINATESVLQVFIRQKPLEREQLYYMCNETELNKFPKLGLNFINIENVGFLFFMLYFDSPDIVNLSGLKRELTETEKHIWGTILDTEDLFLHTSFEDVETELNLQELLKNNLINPDFYNYLKFKNIGQFHTNKRGGKKTRKSKKYKKSRKSKKYKKSRR
jgi:hypothetical protein